MSTFRPSNANQSNYEQNRRVVEPREVSQVYSKVGTYEIPYLHHTNAGAAVIEMSSSMGTIFVH